MFFFLLFFFRVWSCLLKWCAYMEKMSPLSFSLSCCRSSCEQRKLRSRDAARHRRSQETEVFYELANTLPLPRRVTNHLDKSGIMRVLLSFLRLRGLFPPADQEEDDGDPMDCFYPQTLAGFVMTLTEEGDVIYLTENVSRHIGIPQVENKGGETLREHRDYVSCGIKCKIH